MSEDRTKETKDPRTFEERVFARFDTVDGRFDRVEGQLSAVEIRITKLEAKEFDTKPIWERALAEIAELRSEFHTEIEGLRTEMKADSESIRHTMEHELRRFGRKMDVLNQTFLQIQADQRYFDRRLEELETQIEQR
jgi:predicted  nucleic acid-binding Zn-ribbon protein